MKKLFLLILSINVIAYAEVSMLKVSSSSFADQSEIPSKHAYDQCGGDNKSPVLSWSNAPAGAKSFAVITADPDAPKGTFYHWVLFNIPVSVTSTSEGLSKDEQLHGALEGAIQGTNDFKNIGYDGPCPPSGKHRYIFTVYALDANLNLDSSAKAQDVTSAMKGHILGQGQILGYYDSKNVRR
jgi:Raf kinase inhibitor-like YbhB/YbcL family protein